LSEKEPPGFERIKPRSRRSYLVSRETSDETRITRCEERKELRADGRSRLEVTERIVIPADKGIQTDSGQLKIVNNWIPACAGMTQWRRQRHPRIFLLLICLGILFSRGDVCLADFAVQVGAFQSPNRASERAATISRLGFPSTVEQVQLAGKTGLTIVLVGPFEEPGEANAARAALLRNGIDGFVRFYRNGGGKSQETKSAGRLQETTLQNGIKLLSTESIESTLVPNSLFQRIAASLASEPAPSSGPQATSPSAGLPFSISGHVQTATAYTVASPDHWSKLRNTLSLALERELATDIKLKVSGRFSYDGVYDFTTFFPDRVKRDQRIDGMFHETYLDISVSDWSLRFGRQNIIWGEVVGLFFADVVTAKDIREFLVPEFDYIRIPQWAARAEYFKGDFKAEAVWIPYTTYDRIGKPGSDFYPFTIPPPPGFAQQIRSERTPHKWSDSSFGLRASYLTNGWDLAAFYYGSTDSNATFFRTITLAPVPNVSYRPDHERIHQAGLTVSKDTGDFVVKAEAVYTWDRYFNVTRINDTDGVVRQNFLDYVLSADIPLPMDSHLNLQFFQRWFTNHDPDIIPSRVESGASLFASTKLFNEKVEPELLLIHSLNRLDWMARFKINWYFAKDWRLVAGTAFFGGKELGLFGRFDQKDRVFAELRYSF
jgi:hypothetical protein